MKRALIALAATAAILVVARPFEPYTWGHRLTAACKWHPMPSQQLFGGEYMRQADNEAELACWKRHGAHGDYGDVREILKRWPTHAELAAMNGETR